jgi:predicted ATPase/DNA-binding winged helix-turn-helix (wHTH) protein
VTPPFNFERFELRPETRQLLRDGAPVVLGARAFDVLEVLIKHRDRVVTKDEILDLVWTGLVVEENNLQVQISALRKVLGPHSIATVPGRGYRFVLSGTSRGALSTAPEGRRHNLPVQSTPLIGREREIEEVRKALGIARLLSLVGVGGIGKTRLALQTALELVEQFADGVWFAPLAPLSDSRLVTKAAGSALGIKDGAASHMDALIDAVANKELLLVIDNCEHLIDAVARLCEGLLLNCPRARILSTSREMLHIAGESTYRVPPLAAPGPTSAVDAKSLSLIPAVQLFAGRARTVRSSFDVNNGNAAAIASVCRHLDGIPLAIELAAARLGSMSIEEVDRRLDRRLHLLTGGSRAALQRHQTLRALIDWSYDLLQDAEQRVFCRLAVFAGGWTLQAGERVCRSEGIAADDVLDLIASLVDKSLVFTDEHEGTTRYGMLETLREYALERLRDHGGERLAREAHFEHFLGLAEEAEPYLLSAGQDVWLDRLDVEHDNLRTALAWSASPDGDAESGLRLAGALGEYWWMRGYMNEGRRAISELLDVSPDMQAPAIRVKALRAAAAIAMGQADYPAARALHAEGLVISRTLGDRKGVATALLGTGYRIWAQFPDESDTARAMFEECLAIYRELDERGGVAMALNGLANVALLPGRNHALARTRYEEALALFVEIGDRHRAGYAMTGIAYVALLSGESAVAKVKYEEALTLARDLDDRRGIAESMDGLAGAASALADFTRAARIWGATRHLREEYDCAMATAMCPDYERQVTSARAALGDAIAFDFAWQEGRTMSLDDAIEYALSGDEAVLARPIGRATLKGSGA